MKTNSKSQSKSKSYRDEDVYDDRRPRNKVKVLQQNKDARRIERALKRKDYSILTEDLY